MLSVIQTLALIFIIIAGIKILFILFNPSWWLNNVVKRIWSREHFMMLTSLVLSGVILYYLLEELTIVHILAVMLFTSLLAAAGFSLYAKDLLAIAEKYYNKCEGTC